MNPYLATRRITGIYRGSDALMHACIWAPAVNVLDIETENGTIIPLQKNEEGYWHGSWEGEQPELRYWLRKDGVQQLPDPFSGWQPEGVHGISGWMDISSFPWTDEGWQNPPLPEYILYELHTGTFTDEGTFRALEARLDHLVSLGVNAIELMPLSQFPGARNWGYDGVFLFAVQDSYGGPAGLQQLVNACHARGLAVIVDVVYNHFGPEGNYLPALGPCFTDKYHTPWGGAVNYDDHWCDGIRQMVIDNVLMWFRDYHVDALRLDAVHAIRDLGPKHILRDIREAVDEYIELSGKTHYLIAECDLNDPKFINPATDPGAYGMDAQWLDEFHHALRVTMGEPRQGYYADFDGLPHLAKSFQDAYVYTGQFSAHRERHFGTLCDNPGHQFIVFAQNHDQVGNRMLGERLSTLVSDSLLRVAAGVVLLSPFLPMLFMGEEYGETNPFKYFVSHSDPDLVEAVRQGRRAEFAAFHALGEAPDPQGEETFAQSKLQWHLLQKDRHQQLFQWHQSLIALRKKHPALHNGSRKNLHVLIEAPKGLLQLHRWQNNQHVLCYL